MDAKEMALAALRVALATERQGRQFYLEAAAKTSDPWGQELFTLLAGDEVIHEQMLMARLESLERSGSWSAPAEAPARHPLPAAGLPIFSRERVSQHVNDYTYELSALRLAYLIEIDAVAFYRRAAAETANPLGRAMFEELAEMEREHQRVLEGEYRFLADQFKDQMGFAPF
ncbi:MAG: ferritin family protein [Chloroflexi bacterium]|nr:ferritin family protein [Chloroflexota bacterium]